MKSRPFLASLIAGAINLSGLTAGELPRQSESGDSNKAKKVGEEEFERTLATVLCRCEKMLDMQIAVYNGTKDLHKVIERNDDKKPRPQDKRVTLKLADNVEQIVAEATKVIDVMEAEKAAVAFPEFFRELRKDMKQVQDGLANCDVGVETQSIEQDIIQTLREMIVSLKKR
jgi:hypothetical protein